MVSIMNSAKTANFAPTGLGARMILDGVLAEIRGASGDDLIDVARLNAPIAADLCSQGWFEPADVFGEIERAARPNGDAAQFRGILLSAFSHIYVPADVAAPCGVEPDCVAVIRRSVALADNKLTAFELAALEL